MEKLGVEKSELVKELRAKYETLKARHLEMSKLGSVLGPKTIEFDLDLVKQRLDELEKD